MSKYSIKDIGKIRMYTKNFEGHESVVKWEVLEIKNVQDFTVEFIETNSENIQGIRLAVDVGEGYLETDDEKTTELWLWENTASGAIKCRCTNEEGLLSVYNAFFRDSGHGRGVHTQLSSCGMLVEKQGNSYIYRCNDEGFDTNFDKLVFKITLL